MTPRALRIQLQPKVVLMLKTSKRPMEELASTVKTGRLGSVATWA